METKNNNNRQLDLPFPVPAGALGHVRDGVDDSRRHPGAADDECGEQDYDGRDGRDDSGAVCDPESHALRGGQAPVRVAPGLDSGDAFAKSA